MTEDLQHNIPIQAVDLLLEADMIDSLTDMKKSTRRMCGRFVSICSELYISIMKHLRKKRYIMYFDYGSAHFLDCLHIVFTFPFVGRSSHLCDCDEKRSVCD